MKLVSVNVVLSALPNKLDKMQNMNITLYNLFYKMCMEWRMPAINGYRNWMENACYI